MSLWDRHSTKQCDPLACYYCLHPEPDYYCNLYPPENWQAKKRKERLTKAPNSPVEPLSEGE
jgi:hypothetical protein